jgi:hypothetical protein
VYRAVDGGSSHAEELGEVTGGVAAGAVQLDQVFLLRLVELGLTAAQLARGLRDRHSLTGASADR